MRTASVVLAKVLDDMPDRTLKMDAVSDATMEILDPTQELKSISETRLIKRLEEEAAADKPAQGKSKEATAKPARRRLGIDTVKLNKLVVSAYKFMGFGILTVILCGLFSYIATHIFFYVNTSWIEPMVLSPTDPRVLQLSSQLAQESAHRDALVGQKLELESRLHDAQRIAQSAQEFEDAFKNAMQGDLADRKSQLARFGGLLGRYRATRSEIAQNARAFSDVSKGRIAQEYDAHVIDREQMIAGQYQLSQVAGADLSLAERHIELGTRVDELRREVDSLKAVSAGEAHGRAGQVTYDVLRIAHEYERSVLEHKRAVDDAAALEQSISMLAQTIGTYDHILRTIEDSPFVLAADKHETVAFVPYENGAGAKPGTPVYACRVGFVVCRKVGSVSKLLDGEALGRHPLHNKDLRGTMVVLHLDDSTASKDSVLHVGRAPLLL